MEEPSTDGVIVEIETTAETDVVAERTPNKKEVIITNPKAAVALDIELPMVFFDSDKSKVKAEFYERLDEGAALLMDKTELRILVAGHTDSYGDYQYNVALGLRRSKAVMDYLIAQGVDENQLETGTFSEDVPIASNKTIQGRAYNRRVELSFVDEWE